MLPVKIIIGKSPVSTNADGLISLTDLWKAAKGNTSQKPTFWLRQNDVVNFAESLREKAKLTQDQLARTVRGGKSAGTYAHWQIALAYAKYLSPELHMAVNEVFMRYKTGDPTLAEEVIDKVEDPAALERIERRAANSTGAVENISAIDRIRYAGTYNNFLNPAFDSRFPKKQARRS